MWCENHSYEEVAYVIQSCVNSKRNGVLLKALDEEFQEFYGSPIPYEYFGFNSLDTFLWDINNIYVVENDTGEKEVVCYSTKSLHINAMVNSAIPELSVVSMDQFSMLEKMKPIFYGYQAMGDEFFLDIADKVFGYTTPRKGPFEVGLCCYRQTIWELTERVIKASCIAPKVVIMIGLEDIERGRNIRDVIVDLKSLISLLQQQNIKVALVTLLNPLNGTGFKQRTEDRIKIFNKQLLRLKNALKCTVINVAQVFGNKARNPTLARKLNKLEPNNIYNVFSAYGRKLFYKLLKARLQ